MRYVVEKEEDGNWRSVCVMGAGKNETEAFGLSGTGDTPVEALKNLIDAVAEDLGIIGPTHK